MKLSMIVAMDRERGIGKNGKIPWVLKDDLKRFKQLTMGHTIIMGRKTWESIGKPLVGRKMIVITRKKNYQAHSCQIVSNLSCAISAAKAQQDETEAFIIGGGEIYIQAITMVDLIYLTQVDTIAGCDVLFPEFDLEQWQIRDRIFYQANEQNEYSFTYSLLERRNESLP